MVTSVQEMLGKLGIEMIATSGLQQHSFNFADVD